MLAPHILILLKSILANEKLAATKIVIALAAKLITFKSLFSTFFELKTYFISSSLKILFSLTTSAAYFINGSSSTIDL